MIALRHLPKLQVPVVGLEEIKPAIERYMLLIAALVVAFVVVYSAAHALPSKNTALAVGTVRVTVHQGDSLWNYARHYGDPDEYILKKVHRIAKINNLEISRPLEPGQELIIPCERKTVCASTDRQMP